MKKLLSVICCVCLFVSMLSGCSGEGETVDSSTPLDLTVRAISAQTTADPAATTDSDSDTLILHLYEKPDFVYHDFSYPFQGEPWLFRVPLFFFFSLEKFVTVCNFFLNCLYITMKTCYDGGQRPAEFDFSPGKGVKKA